MENQADVDETKAGEPPPGPFPSPQEGTGPQAMRPRVTVTGSAVYQAEGLEPTVITKPFGYQAKTDDPPCVRPGIKVTEEWQPLSGLWVEDVGLLVIANDGPPRRPTNPTPGERRADEDAVLLIGVTLVGETVAACQVSPGRSVRLEPPGGCLTGYSLRCRLGTTRATVAAFPV